MTLHQTVATMTQDIIPFDGIVACYSVGSHAEVSSPM
jgi:hypothetical protein